MTLAWKLALWFIPIAINIYADRKGQKPFYLVVNLLRGMVAIAHGALFVTTYEGWTYYWLPVLTFQITSYWIFFELGLNIVRKNPLLYYDRKEGDSGWIDRFFKWTGPVAHVIAKLICFVAMIYSIILIYKRNG